MFGFRVTLPRSYAKELEVRTASGDPRVEDVKVAGLTAKTVSGDIHIDRAEIEKGGVIESVSGDIEAQSVRGSLSSKNVSGDIEMNECTGELNAETVSGDVALKVFDGPVSGRTVSGDIEAKPKSADGWRFNLSATSGDIENALSEDAKSTKLMNCKSTSGDIRVLRVLLVIPFAQRKTDFRDESTPLHFSIHFQFACESYTF